MKCSDIPRTLIRKRMAVINTESPDWPALRAELGISGTDAQATCFRRLTERGELRRLRRGIYLAVDVVREAPVIAIASGACAHLPHYVTTDRALEFHGLINQPISTTLVAAAGRVAPIPLDGTHVIKVVQITGEHFRRADVLVARPDGFQVHVASTSQAVLDALVDPGRMIYLDLLPEVLDTLDPRDVDHLARLALAAGSAPAQRLGYLLDQAGRVMPEPLMSFVPTFTVHLRPSAKRKQRYSTKWRVYA